MSYSDMSSYADMGIKRFRIVRLRYPICFIGSMTSMHKIRLFTSNPSSLATTLAIYNPSSTNLCLLDKFKVREFVWKEGDFDRTYIGKRVLYKNMIVKMR